MTFLCPYCGTRLEGEAGAEAPVKCPDCQSQVGVPRRPPASDAKLITLTGLADLGGALAAVGFFLSWGTHRSSGDISVAGRSYGSYQFTFALTGADAHFYGYSTLALGILVVLLATAGVVTTLRKRRVVAAQLALAMCFVAALGAAILILMRGDKSVTVFGSVGYALRHGDWTLGYTLGPGLALLGFLLATVASIFLRRRSLPKGQRLG